MAARYEYGVKRRSDGVIVQKALKDIKAGFKTPNLTYVYGEIYMREVGTGAEGWVRMP